MGAIVLTAAGQRNLVCDVRVAAEDRGVAVRYSRKHLHFIWADRAVLWLAMLFVALAVIGWILVALAAGPAGANHVVASLGLNATPVIVLASVWATLRAIDFIAKGSTYRLFMAQPEQAANSTDHAATSDHGKPMAAH